MSSAGMYGPDGERNDNKIRYKMPAGTKILRRSRSTGWQSFVTTKEAHFSDNDVDKKVLRPRIGDIVFKVPVSDYTRIAVNEADIEWIRH